MDVNYSKNLKRVHMYEICPPFNLQTSLAQPWVCKTFAHTLGPPETLALHVQTTRRRESTWSLEPENPGLNHRCASSQLHESILCDCQLPYLIILIQSKGCVH